MSTFSRVDEQYSEESDTVENPYDYDDDLSMAAIRYAERFDYWAWVEDGPPLTKEEQWREHCQDMRVYKADKEIVRQKKFFTEIELRKLDEENYLMAEAGQADRIDVYAPQPVADVRESPGTW